MIKVSPLNMSSSRAWAAAAHDGGGRALGLPGPARSLSADVLTTALCAQAFTPVSVLLVSAAFGLKELTRKILFIVSLISFGVALASYGELDFEIWGFLVQVRRSALLGTFAEHGADACPASPQALAICIESCRLVLVQKLLQGFGLDPIASLYYMAPVCLAINAVILLPVEGFQVFEDAVNLVGIPYLFFK